MNALKFLAVDRSLDSKKEVVGRFRMREPGVLPVLGASDSGAGAAPQRSMWRRFVGWVGGTATQKAPARPAEVQPELPRTPAIKPAVVPAKAAPVAGPRAVEAAGRSSLLSSCNPFGRASRRSEQGEFRFENVRVVCNELHDTDFIIKT